ncbi:MAG: hypothetical protein ACJAQT_000851 [Akkermansiaceae bacterium]|jgi:hypothetical protein
MRIILLILAISFRPTNRQEPAAVAPANQPPALTTSNKKHEALSRALIRELVLAKQIEEARKTAQNRKLSDFERDEAAIHKAAKPLEALRPPLGSDPTETSELPDEEKGWYLIANKVGYLQAISDPSLAEIARKSAALLTPTCSAGNFRSDRQAIAEPFQTLLRSCDLATPFS